MTDNNYPCKRFDQISKALTSIQSDQVLLILADNYPNEKTILHKGFYEEVNNKNLKVYVEFPDRLPEGETGMIVTVDKYTRFLLTVIALLLGITAAGLWLEAPNTVAPAQARAGIPDSGSQLQQLVEQAEVINVSINEIKSLLVSGGVKVQIVDPAKITKKKKSIKKTAAPAKPLEPIK